MGLILTAATMPPRRFRMTAPSASAGQRADRVLANLLHRATGHAWSQRSAARLIERGAVRLEGRILRGGSELVGGGARFEATLEPRARRSAEAHSFEPFEIAAEHVRYEDEDLIVVAKPEGLSTHATIDPNRPHLHGAVQRYLAQTGDGYAGIHHRLDVDTSGLVLFTKRKEANPKVADLFAERRIHKVYWAVVTRVSGEPVPPSWQIRNYLGRLLKVHGKTRYGAVRTGGDLAETDFRVLETLSPLKGGGPGAWLVEARPRTGRTHQIRVHLSGSGLPILGDPLYEGLPAGRLMLHARQLAFVHPMMGNPIEVTAPPPSSFFAILQRVRGQR